MQLGFEFLGLGWALVLLVIATCLSPTFSCKKLSQRLRQAPKRIIPFEVLGLLTIICGIGLIFGFI